MQPAEIAKGVLRRFVHGARSSMGLEFKFIAQRNIVDVALAKSLELLQLVLARLDKFARNSAVGKGVVHCITARATLRMITPTNNNKGSGQHQVWAEAPQQAAHRDGSRSRTDLHERRLPWPARAGYLRT